MKNSRFYRARNFALRMCVIRRNYCGVYVMNVTVMLSTVILIVCRFHVQFGVDVIG